MCDVSYMVEFIPSVARDLVSGLNLSREVPNEMRGEVPRLPILTV